MRSESEGCVWAHTRGWRERRPPHLESEVRDWQLQGSRPPQQQVGEANVLVVPAGVGAKVVCGGTIGALPLLQGLSGKARRHYVQAAVGEGEGSHRTLARCSLQHEGTLRGERVREPGILKAATRAADVKGRTAACILCSRAGARRQGRLPEPPAERAIVGVGRVTPAAAFPAPLRRHEQHVGAQLWKVQKRVVVHLGDPLVRRVRRITRSVPVPCERLVRHRRLAALGRFDADPIGVALQFPVDDCERLPIAAHAEAAATHVAEHVSDRHVRHAAK